MTGSWRLHGIQALRARGLLVALALARLLALPNAARADDLALPATVETQAAGGGSTPPTASEEQPAAGAEAKKPSVAVTYGSHGLDLRSVDGNFRAWFTLRAQLRASSPFEDDPQEPGDLAAADEASFSVNRSRLKWGGHVYRPWLDYYMEYELGRSKLLDLRFTFQKWDAFQLRIGQWKPEYNRERRDSSGEQQFVDRSIANRVFTIDRQSGVMASGRLWKATRADSHWWLGALVGEGLGTGETGGTPLVLGRWQWNFTGRELGFSQSDVERKSAPHGSLAVAALRNRSRATRFSQDGGGELDGFPGDVAERYDVEQALLELAWQRRGFSFQAELHRKEIEDRTGQIPGVSRFEGGYAQAGYFVHGCWERFPEPLELALRVARVDARETPSREATDELTLAANWFFAGHRNKLSADVSLLGFEEPGFDDDGIRFRLQWDVSL